MENVIKYAAYAKALPPRVIRMTTGDWGGPPEKMQDGSDPQPWHCLPFVEGSTFGLELVYPYETECHVVGAGGTIRFDWDFAREPGGEVTGEEFKAFSPVQAAKYYLFNTRLDLQPPPGYVVRTEPHPRFFTDDTGTVPLALIGHLQNEWYPRMVFVVFRAPGQGQRHIFRKGEPFVQILFVPQRMQCEITRMTPAEAGARRELEKAIHAARLEIAENIWRNRDGGPLNNHYKVLARAFARAGTAGVEEVVREALDRQKQAIPKGENLAESLALGAQLLEKHQYEPAKEIYAQILEINPACTEALTNLGICYATFGNLTKGLELMEKAVALEPRLPKYHSNLGELLRRVGRLPEAENSIRLALQLGPNDPGTLCVLGLVLAQQGRTAEGLEAYRAAVAVGYSYPATHFKMGLILAQQNYQSEARACFEAALAIDPGFAPARQELQKLVAGPQSYVS